MKKRVLGLMTAAMMAGNADRMQRKFSRKVHGSGSDNSGNNSSNDSRNNRK